MKLLFALLFAISVFGQNINWNQIRNPPLLSVTAFGATGDGVTNDRTAIQAAIDALPDDGGTIYFPAGTYAIGSSIVVKSFTRLLGEGYTYVGDGQSTIKGTGAFNVITSIDEAQSVIIDNLTVVGNGASGSRGIYAVKKPSGWVITNSNFHNFGDECIKLGAGVNAAADVGVTGYIEHVIAYSCVLVRTGRTDYIGAVDVGVSDLFMSNVEATASVEDLMQPTYPGQGLIGSGFIAAIVIRQTGNGWFTNLECEISQVGCVFMGVGPAYVSGNRADLNQGAGFLFLNSGTCTVTNRCINEINVIGNWSHRNSMTADAAHPGFLNEGGRMTFVGNSCTQNGTDTGAAGFPRMSNCFTDTASTPGPVQWANTYIGNRSSGIKNQTYAFSGTAAKNINDDPNWLSLKGPGSVPFVSATGGYTLSPQGFVIDNPASYEYRLGLGASDVPLTILSATTANPMVLTLSTAVPSTWIVGDRVLVTGATYSTNDLVTPSSCPQMNGPQVISAKAGSTLTITFDGTACTYLASSGTVTLGPHGSLSANFPGDATNGRTASLFLGGRVVKQVWQDKRALPFGADNSRWLWYTNYDEASQTYNQVVLATEKDDRTEGQRFVTYNRAPLSHTALYTALHPSVGYVVVGDALGDNSANGGKFQIYGGTLQFSNTGIAFASLPTAGAHIVWCSNCNIANPCTTGGTGAWAFRNQASGTWNCTVGGSGGSDLTQVAENATDNAIPRAVGTSGRILEQTLVLVDDSNNLSTPGSISSGTGGSVAGGFQATQGTLPTPAANSIVINAPTSVATAYQFTLPGAAATGFRFGTNSSNVVTESFVAAAVASEVTTGTDTSKPITPNALADSTIFGVKTVEVEVFPAGTAAATGDGKAYFYVPASINGMNLISIIGQVYTVGTTNTLNVDIARCATVATGNVCSGTVVDVLSTNLTIDSNEDDSGTAAAEAVIDTSNDDVATGQVYRIDVDAIHTTPSQGLLVILTFQLP